MNSESVHYDLPLGRTVRATLLDFGANFVSDIRGLPGVLRIAMLGSVLTPKPDPKDIDFLVTVADDCDLAPVARFARRLQGRAQGLNHSADVFLASPEGRYLGRTCYWRDCRPGIRASCDAAHCGARAFLHNDFYDVALPDDLVAKPPLELWPTVVVRATLPADVTAWLAETEARTG